MKSETIRLPNGGELVKAFHLNNTVASVSYFREGRLHRLKGPAYRYWNENGMLTAEEYRINDQCHRIDGPARLEWENNGRLALKLFYFQGEPISEAELMAKYLAHQSPFLQVIEAFNNATPNQAIGLNF